MTEVADAIRKVTARVQRVVDDGLRSRKVDADDVIEILLAIADQLDPQTAGATLPQVEDGEVYPADSCPQCGEYRVEQLTLRGGRINCRSCGTEYDRDRD